MLPKDLIKRIRRLEITTRKVVSALLAGQYHSVFKGRGMAFSEVRQYQPGDEVRTIDWNVTARMNDAYVKVFTEERELTVMLLVDVSASEEFGSKVRSKGEMAAEIAAQIAFSAIANNDRVGLVLFTDQVEKVVPPRKGKKHVLRVVSDILSFKPKGKRTNLSAGLTWLSHAARRKTVTFLISDFLAQGYDASLRIVARKHDVVPVVVIDPFEEKFPSLGLAELEDPETGERWLVDTSNPRIRGRFAEAMKKRREERIKLFRKLQLDHVELRSGEDYSRALQRFFQARARRMAA
jgi:uncharacterized protein (DUF58 family)